MPYKILKKGNKYELRLIEGNKLMGTHDSKLKAEKQRMAIEISKNQKIMKRK
jgi:hypothetical protein